MADIEISRGEDCLNKTVKRMPYVKNGLYTCNRCNMPMFSVVEKRLRNYAYYIKCKCGAEYDLTDKFGMRLGETVNIIKHKG